MLATTVAGDTFRLEYSTVFKRVGYHTTLNSTVATAVPPGQLYYRRLRTLGTVVYYSTVGLLEVQSTSTSTLSTVQLCDHSTVAS